MDYRKKGGTTTLKRHGTTHLSKAGKKGGTATLESHGIEHFKKISKLAVEARWGKK